MRKVKLRRCEYDYVEVMACPSGAVVGCFACSVGPTGVLLLLDRRAPSDLAVSHAACQCSTTSKCASCCCLITHHILPAPSTSGCLNGGGQPKPAAGQTTAQLLERLETLYLSQDGASSAAAIGHSGGSDGGAAALQQLYAEWVGGPPGSEAACRLLHTQYHKREKTVTATLADW